MVEAVGHADIRSLRDPGGHQLADVGEDARHAALTCRDLFGARFEAASALGSHTAVTVNSRQPRFHKSR